MGRKPYWTPELQRNAIEQVLEEIAKGRALSRVLSEEPNLPSVTEWYLWEREVEGLKDEVTHARELGAASLVEEMVDIADDSSTDVYIDYDKDGLPIAKVDGDVVQRAKLRIYAREKYAQMIAPRRFGPKIDVTSDGEKLPAPQVTNLGVEKVQALVQLALSRREGQETVDEETRKLLE